MLTTEWIDLAERAGWDTQTAEAARAWVTAAPRTVEDLARDYPHWVCVAAAYAPVPPALLAECAARDPREALRWATGAMPREEVQALALRAPLWALHYAPAEVTTETLSECARRLPHEALFSPARKRLPHATLAYCAQRYPLDALRCVRHLLDVETLAACLRALDDDALARIARSVSEEALWAS